MGKGAGMGKEEEKETGRIYKINEKGYLNEKKIKKENVQIMFYLLLDKKQNICPDIRTKAYRQ